MVGIELFYPTQEQQVQLLASLMAPEDHASSGAIDGGSLERWHPRSPRKMFSRGIEVCAKMKKHLLVPLLNRLSDDALVSSMVPYHESVAPLARGMVHQAFKKDNPSASVALLSRLLASLVKQLTLRLTKGIENKRSSGDSTPRGEASGFSHLLSSLQSTSSAGPQVRLALVSCPKTCSFAVACLHSLALLRMTFMAFAPT